MKVLDINGISKRYGNTQAVNEFSLSINKGSIYGILGPNGSGKTTILSIILGVVRQDSGSFVWSGSEKDTKTQNIGALLETPNFYSYLSLEKNLEIVARIKKIESYSIDDVLEKTGLRERKFSKYYTLSLGMKQRLAIAGILLGNPEILVLDEPTNGLDPLGRLKIRKLIEQLKKQGKTIFFSSHELSEIETVCDEIIMIANGRIMQQGPVAELVGDKPNLEHYFL